MIEMKFEPEVRAVMVDKALKALSHYELSRDWVDQMIDRIIDRHKSKEDGHEFVADELRYYGFISEAQAVRIGRGIDWSQL